MTMTTEGRLTVAEAAELNQTDPAAIGPDNAPLYTIQVTITTPAVDEKHAAELASLCMDAPFVQVGLTVGLLEVAYATPEPVEA